MRNHNKLKISMTSLKQKRNFDKKKKTHENKFKFS